MCTSERIIRCEPVESGLLLVSTQRWSAEHQSLATVHEQSFWYRILVRTKKLSILLPLPGSEAEGDQLSHASTYRWQGGDGGRDCFRDSGGSKCKKIEKNERLSKIRDLMQTWCSIHKKNLATNTQSSKRVLLRLVGDMGITNCGKSMPYRSSRISGSATSHASFRTFE